MMKISDLNPQEIYQAWREAKEIKHTNLNLDLELAKKLIYLHKDKRYRVITGNGKSTWMEFLGDPEFQLSYEKARRIMRIYEVYIEKFQIPENEIYGIDQRSLLNLISVVNKDNVREWLLKAKNLSRTDLQRELKFGDVDAMTCEHEFKKTQEISECPKCGEVKRRKLVECENCGGLCNRECDNCDVCNTSPETGN